jgi:6-phospho-beta-glucosidase
VKITILGGGGFRTPIVWRAIRALAESVPVDEVVLYDTSEERLARVSLAIAGMHEELGGGPPVRSSTDLHPAVEGASFIFCAIRVGGLEGRVVDETIPLAEGVLGQETVGPGGICFALRALPHMKRIADVVKERAPDSWFLNFTNPAGLITEATREALDDRVVGVCDSPAGLCARVAAALGERMANLEFGYSGLNHLGWLSSVKRAGVELLPSLLADDGRLGEIEETHIFGAERVRELGMIPNEYLIYYEASERIVAAFKRVGASRAEIIRNQEAGFYGSRSDRPRDVLAEWKAARDARFGTYMDEVRDPANEATSAQTSGAQDEGPGEEGYAAIALDFVRGVQGEPASDQILNVRNDGALPFLDASAVVEVPCALGPGGPRARQTPALPAAQAELVARVKEVERLTIRASVEGSRALALEALAIHPVVPSRAVADKILEGYMRALPELAEMLH